MSKRLKYYLAGLATGILLGIGIMFIFQSGRQAGSSRKDLSKKYIDSNKPGTEQKTVSSDHFASKSTTKENGTEKSTLENDINKDTTATVDSLNNDQSETDTLKQEQDTITGENELVIMQDKLIATSRLPVKQLNDKAGELPDNNKNLDSLLIDDPNTNTKEPDSLLVEFWENPINYKGYRKIKNRLIIFGMTEEDSIKIFKGNDNYFMKIRNKKFPLKETNNFRPIWFED